MATTTTAQPEHDAFDEDLPLLLDPALLASIDADAAAALNFLTAHADAFPGGDEVAACLARRRRTRRAR